MRLSPAPYRDYLIGAMSSTGATLSRQWERWFALVEAAFKQSRTKLGELVLTGQSAALAQTAIPTPRLVASRYRVMYYTRVTQAATTSSSLTVTIHWTDGGVACSRAAAAMTGNTTSTTSGGQNHSVLVEADPGSTIDVSTAYASVGATPMLYKLYAVVEEMP